MNWKQYFSNAKNNGPAIFRVGNQEEMYQAFRARLMDEMKVVNYRLVLKDPNEADRKGSPNE